MWCWNVYLTRKCYCRLSVFGVVFFPPSEMQKTLWFIIIYRSGWKLQANLGSRAGGARGSEHPEITVSVFHTAPLACCSFWSLFTAQALFERKQSCSDVIVQPVCCSKIKNFLGRVKVGVKHPSGALSTHGSPESQNSPLLLQTLPVPEGNHTCGILQSSLGLVPFSYSWKLSPPCPEWDAQLPGRTFGANQAGSLCQERDAPSCLTKSSKRQCPQRWCNTSGEMVWGKGNIFQVIQTRNLVLHDSKDQFVPQEEPGTGLCLGNKLSTAQAL